MIDCTLPKEKTALLAKLRDLFYGPEPVTLKQSIPAHVDPAHYDQELLDEIVSPLFFGGLVRDSVYNQKLLKDGETPKPIADHDVYIGIFQTQFFKDNYGKEYAEKSTAFTGLQRRLTKTSAQEGSESYTTLFREYTTARTAIIDMLESAISDFADSLSSIAELENVTVELRPYGDNNTAREKFTFEGQTIDLTIGETQPDPTSFCFMLPDTPFSAFVADLNGTVFAQPESMKHLEHSIYRFDQFEQLPLGLRVGRIHYLRAKYPELIGMRAPDEHIPEDYKDYFISPDEPRYREFCKSTDIRILDEHLRDKIKRIREKYDYAFPEPSTWEETYEILKHEAAGTMDEYIATHPPPVALQEVDWGDLDLGPSNLTGLDLD